MTKMLSSNQQHISSQNKHGSTSMKCQKCPYSRVSNKRTCTFIFFVSNFPPVRTLLDPVRLFILKNLPACTFISSCTFIRFCPILIQVSRKCRKAFNYFRTCCGRFRQIFPCTFILACTFIYFGSNS